jgi:hypothetical protein
MCKAQYPTGNINFKGIFKVLSGYQIINKKITLLLSSEKLFQHLFYAVIKSEYYYRISLSNSFQDFCEYAK